VKPDFPLEAKSCGEQNNCCPDPVVPVVLSTSLPGVHSNSSWFLNVLGFMSTRQQPVPPFLRPLARLMASVISPSLIFPGEGFISNLILLPPRAGIVRISLMKTNSLADKSHNGCEFLFTPHNSGNSEDGTSAKRNKQSEV